MIIVRYSSFLTLALSFVFAPAAQQCHAQKAVKLVEIQVAGAKLLIPPPADLVAKKSELKTTTKLMTKAAPTNTIHEIFASKTDTEATAIRLGLKRNADIQSINQIRIVGQPLFDQLKTLLTNQFDTLMKAALKDVNRRTGIAFKTQEKVGKGTFVDEKNRFAYLMFSHVGPQEGGVDRVTAACLCFVKNRIILVNLHSNLESPKDAEWVKKESQKWIAAICKANQ
jgi:hypothetical protein